MRTNPEELIAAAHAGCFSMALAAAVQEAGHLPVSIDSHAKVKLEKHEQRFATASITLAPRVRVSGTDNSKFSARRGRCRTQLPPGSKALGAVASIQLDATPGQ